VTEYNQPIDSSVMPRCSQPATLMRLPFVSSAEGLDIALYGVPFDLGCTNRNGPRLGPAQIRDMSRLIRRVNPTTGVNPYALANVADVGDAKINMMSLEASIENIAGFVADITGAGAAPIAVGGDHTIPLPIFRGMRESGYATAPLAVLHVDAHADTFDSLGESRVNHATAFRRTVEEGLQDPARTVQLGLRGTRYAEDDIQGSYDMGMRVITMDDFEELGRKGTIEAIHETVGDGPVYITIDVDGLDPMCMPGTGAPEPGGIMMRDMQMILRSLRGLYIVGGDVCEVAPPLDPYGLTALNAANLMFEILCLTAESVARRTGRL
jgi:guanidinopropionase